MQNTQTAHTPGPWTAVKCTTRDGFTVGQKYVFERQTARVANIAQVGPFEADARLIASAPELLAALEDLAERASWYNLDDGFKAKITLARAAIAKAKGVQS